MNAEVETTKKIQDISYAEQEWFGPCMIKVKTIS